MSLSLEHSHADKQSNTSPSCSMFELSTVGCMRALRIKFKFLMEMETQNFSYWCRQSIYVALFRATLLEGDTPLREMLPTGEAPPSTRGLVSRP